MIILTCQLGICYKSSMRHWLFGAANLAFAIKILWVIDLFLANSGSKIIKDAPTGLETTNRKQMVWVTVWVSCILAGLTRIQCFSIICRSLKRSKLHCTQWKINGLVSARSSKSMISNELSTGNQNIYYLPLWQLSRFLYKLVIWINSSAHISIYILYIHK